MPRATSRNAINPLPSFLRASAWDAGSQSARGYHKKWTRADYNRAAATQERLTLACYGRPWDREGSKLPFIRFSIAEQLEREGLFTIDTDFGWISEQIDICLVANVGIPLTH